VYISAIVTHPPTSHRIVHLLNSRFCFARPYQHCISARPCLLRCKVEHRRSGTVPQIESWLVQRTSSDAKKIQSLTSAGFRWLARVRVFVDAASAFRRHRKFPMLRIQRPPHEGNAPLSSQIGNHLAQCVLEGSLWYTTIAGGVRRSRQAQTNHSPHDGIVHPIQCRWMADKLVILHF
jgi:hypothetical protein